MFLPCNTVSCLRQRGNSKGETSPELELLSPSASGFSGFSVPLMSQKKNLVECVFNVSRGLVVSWPSLPRVTDLAWLPEEGCKSRHGGTVSRISTASCVC